MTKQQHHGMYSDTVYLILPVYCTQRTRADDVRHHIRSFSTDERTLMVALVRIALRRPYTFVVLALLIAIIGPLAALRTPTDIFPDIRIPVIAVIWQYTGLPPDQMSGRMTTPFQRALTTTVNDIEHIEANSYNGVGIVKIFFQPDVDIRTANAQVTAISQTLLKQLPPGTTPPLILNYNASTVPIIQFALSGKGMSEQTLADLGLNVIRTPLVTVPGAAIPLPFGGKLRQVQMDLDSVALQARGLSGQDVANALAAQNLITPIGTQKIGDFEYTIQLNDAPSRLADLADLPIKSVNGAMVYVHDVAQVRDGNPPQTNIVHVDGGRSVLMQVLKNGSVSTLDIIAGVKRKVEELKAILPDALNITAVGDQSVFVRGAIAAVVREGAIAAALTSLMILLFLGSWRSTIIIAISIPLSVLGSIAVLSALGETLNIMTLGGLALAVGILVDEATVTIENINWHLEQGKEVETAILDGAMQIVTPAFVSLLCICIVFVPMFFLTGVARFLFVPMAEAVVFAMIWSFILSRTLVPTMAKYLLRPHAPHTDMHGNNAVLPPSRNPLVRLQRGFEERFERARTTYRELLELAFRHRALFVGCFLAFVVGSMGLVPFLGRNFFPAVDTGRILLHARVPVGTRLEESTIQFANIQKAIRQLIPSEELGTMVDNIGLPVSGINMTYNNNGTIGPQDGNVQITLQEGHRPTSEYVRILRDELPLRFPGVMFSFLPADIVSQILNFGAPAPIDLQIRGPDLAASFNYASELLRQMRHIPGVADARIQQSHSYPTFNVDVDRTRAQYVGVTERDVTNSLVVNLAGSGQVAPTYWLNPDNGVSYAIVMQTPQYQIDSLSALQNLPITAEGAPAPQILGGIANVTRAATNAVVTQYNIQAVVQIYAATQGRDLGAVAADIQNIVDANAKDAPRGTTAVLQGQVQTMNTAFSGLLFGLLGAIVLIYLLIVVNFQSWGDPLVIIAALPAALAGIVWMLFATQTTLSVPALTGAIMCMGVATANSVLVISFARERLEETGDAVRAAIEAGFVRMRPVLMTALAMIIGMVPMALGLGEGGEQNAPLGRAVIGGLIFATVATLAFVPVVFSILHERRGKQALKAEELHVT
jgi:multidrug efflux pump subunit AcrB